MPESYLLPSLTLLLAVVAAGAVGGSFPGLIGAGWIIGIAVAAGNQLLVSLVASCPLSHDQKIFVLLPWLGAQFFAVVSAVSYLHQLVGEQRQTVVRLLGLGLSVRRIVAVLLVRHWRSQGRAIFGETVPMVFLRLLLAAGFVVLTSQILPLMWAAMLIPVAVLVWIVAFASVVTVVIKFWEQKRNLPRVTMLRRVP